MYQLSKEHERRSQFKTGLVKRCEILKIISLRKCPFKILPQNQFCKNIYFQVKWKYFFYQFVHSLHSRCTSQRWQIDRMRGWTVSGHQLWYTSSLMLSLIKSKRMIYWSIVQTVFQQLIVWALEHLLKPLFELLLEQSFTFFQTIDQTIT